MASFSRALDSMLIYWGMDESLGIPLEHEKLALFATELLRARRLGNHLVVIEREICSLLQNCDLSNSEKKLLARVSDEYTQNGTAIERHVFSIEVVNSLDEFMETNDNRVQMSISSILSSSILDKPLLILENQARDGFLYRLALEHGSPHPVSFDIRHGGGADVISVFSHYLTRSVIVAAAVDSDKLTPHTKANPKLSALKTAIRNGSWSLAYGFSPDCREVENMIPLTVVSKLPSAITNPSHASIVTLSHEEKSEESDKFWNFFDIKEGVKHKKYRKSSDEDKAWLAGKLDIIKISCDATDDDFNYLSGYGARVVDQIIAAEHLQHELKESFSQKRWKATFGGTIESLRVVYSSLEPLAAYG